MIGVMVLLAQAFIANAQDEEKKNTGESVGKQFLNNRVPGMQYAPAKPKTQRRATLAEQQENHDESSGMQLKKGTLKGMTMAPGARNTNLAPRTTAKRSAPSGTLSSDQKAEAVKPAVLPATQPPTQGGVQTPKDDRLNLTPRTGNPPTGEKVQPAVNRNALPTIQSVKPAAHGSNAPAADKLKPATNGANSSTIDKSKATPVKANPAPALQ